MVLNEESIDYDSNISLEWKELTKVYTDKDVLALGEKSQDEIMNELDQGNYCYVTSVFYDDIEIEVTFSKGLPPSDGVEDILTETQYDEVVQNEGKWFVSSIGIVQDGCESIYNKIKKLDSKYEDIAVAASQIGFNYPIVIGFNDNKAVDVITTYDTAINSSLEKNRVEKSSMYIYDFDEVAVMARENIEIQDAAVEMEDTLLSIDSEYENSIIPLSQVNYKQISVIKYYQEETKWCWAACAKMLGKYYTGTAKSQSNICNYVKGSVVNETATNSEIRTAIGYAIGGSYIATNVGVQSYSVFETKIYTNEKPFVLKITWNSGGAHVYVVAGVNGGTAQQVYLIDPEEGVSNKWYSYSALVNGTTLTSGTGSYTRTFLVS